MTLHIGMVYDLRSAYLAEGYAPEDVAEFDAETTIEAIVAALSGLGHRVERIGHGRELCRRLAAGDRWDLVFNFAEGRRGRSREAQVPALLELFEIPYTFSDPLVCAVTLDKAVAKRLVRSAGLATPAFRLVNREADLAALDLAFPVFAKPVAEGTGKGIDDRSRIETREELAAACRRLRQRFRQPVLVEEYLPGREFTTGILGTEDAARVLGTMEIRARSNAPTLDYSFEMKERCEEFVEYTALERGPLRAEVEALALAAYRALQCRDAGRVDIRLDRQGRPAFLEVNPLPGLNPAHSDLPMIAAQNGLSFDGLIGAIVESALERVPGAGRPATPKPS